MATRRKASRYSRTARDFVSREIAHLIRDKGYSQPRAITAALRQARQAGYKVPSLPNVAASWVGLSRTRKRRKKAAARKRIGGARGARRASRPRARSNPGTVIGDSTLELTYSGGQGKRKGKMRGPWKHVFESDDVQVIGKKDGSVLLRSKSGEKLWGHFEV